MASDDAKIRRLWTDINFKGSLSGSYTFYKCLKDENAKYKIRDLTYSRVLRVLSTIDAYQKHVKRKKGYVTRRIQFEASPEGGAFVTGMGSSFHIDLAEAPATDEGYRFFLIIVDIWNNYIYCEALKSKEKGEVMAAIKRILTLNSLDHAALFFSDEGTEFTSNRANLEKLGIRLIILKGAHHAFMAERYIKVVKRRLMLLQRYKIKKSWNKELQQIVKNINSSPSRALHYLSPASLNSPYSDPLVRGLRREVRAEMADKLKPTSAADVFQEGQYVYPDIKGQRFDDRSFHQQRGQVMQIASVDRSQQPWLYSLIDLAGDKVKEKYYGWKLRAAPEGNPFAKDSTVYKPIEAILDERYNPEIGEKEYLVKFWHYKPKMNTWIPKSEMMGLKEDEKKKKKKKKK